MTCGLTATWFAAIGQVLVGLAVVYIAWRQHRTARDKLRLDLFDKRFSIWLSLKRLLAAINSGSMVSFDSIARFTAETSEAKWIFGPEVVEYLEIVGKEANKLYAYQARAADYERGGEVGMAPGNVNHTELIDNIGKLLTWFPQQANEVSMDKFSRYLDFTR
jgi:hypothetical protein